MTDTATTPNHESAASLAIADDLKAFHQKRSGNWDNLEAAEAEIRKLVEANERLRAELELERMRLTACGVIAMSNTRTSLANARKVHPDYVCASVNDVIRAVEREIEYREKLDAAKERAMNFVSEVF